MCYLMSQKYNISKQSIVFKKKCNASNKASVVPFLLYCCFVKLSWVRKRQYAAVLALLCDFCGGWADREIIERRHRWSSLVACDWLRSPQHLLEDLASKSPSSVHWFTIEAQCPPKKARCHLPQINQRIMPGNWLDWSVNFIASLLLTHALLPHLQAK